MSFKSLLLGLFLSVASPLVAEELNFTPVATASYNGHQYYLLPESDWNTAQERAYQMGGRLAIINDSAENLWIYNTFSNDDKRIWFGLTDSVEEGEFQYIDWYGLTCEQPSYRNWASGRPSSGAANDFAQMFQNGKWYDMPGSMNAFALVEIYVSQCIPEPNKSLLLFGGLVACLMRRRRTQNER